MKTPPLLRVDDRVGSVELAAPLRKLSLPVAVERMDAGDFAFEGEGRGGRVERVGIERKRLDDALTCIRTRRWADEQLPKMRAAYDTVVLIVEGLWRDGDDGRLEVWRRGGWGDPASGARMAAELRTFVLTQQFKAGVHVVMSPTQGTTCEWIRSCYSWWNGVGGGYDRHHSHGGGVYLPRETIGRLNAVGTMACGIDGIGPTLAVYVQEAFRSPREAVTATLKRWASVEAVTKKGKRFRLGAARALKAIEWARGGELEGEEDGTHDG